LLLDKKLEQALHLVIKAISWLEFQRLCWILFIKLLLNHLKPIRQMLRSILKNKIFAVIEITPQ